MTLCLSQGPSYLALKEHRFRVFCYDFSDSVLKELRDNELLGAGSFLKARKSESFSRLYPHLLGLMGNPGDGLAIAQKRPDGRTYFNFGYIGWNRFPVFLFCGDTPSDDPKTWQIHLEITLDPLDVVWLVKRIDRRTRLVKARMLSEGAKRQQVMEAREQALKKSKRALAKFRDRGKAKERAARKKERERIAAERREWEREVLGNLQAIYNRYKLRNELRKLAEELEVQAFI